MEIINPSLSSSIIDVGGTKYNWELIKYEGNVVILNLTIPENLTNVPQNYLFVEGDGTKLTYPDCEFDILFSNSVIEHLGTYDRQKKFADEARRVGRSLWIQTPAKSFFIEPHFITPFIHYLSKHWQKKLLRNFSLWGLITRPSSTYIDKIVDELRLLSYKELQNLFPDSEIIEEKFIFFVKSYIVVRR